VYTVTFHDSLSLDWQSRMCERMLSTDALRTGIAEGKVPPPIALQLRQARMNAEVIRDCEPSTLSPGISHEDVRMAANCPNDNPSAEKDPTHGARTLSKGGSLFTRTRIAPPRAVIDADPARWRRRASSKSASRHA
jgi:hypothetical protein